MLAREAIHIIARHALASMDKCDIQTQIRCYEALSLVLPDQNERIAAARIATNIRDNSNLQLDLFTALKSTNT